MDYRDPGRYIILAYSKYLLGVPCLGFPLKSGAVVCFFLV